MASEKIVKFVEEIKQLTVIELSELVKAIEVEFGVSAAAPVAVSGGGQGAVAAVEEEQTEFDVILTSAGASKIKVIKVVRELTGLGLKEAKDAVDGAPTTVKTAVTKEEADKAKAALEAEGAVAEIK